MKTPHSTEEVWKRQFDQKACRQSPAPTQTLRQPAHEIWAKQFAPKPVNGPASAPWASLSPMKAFTPKASSESSRFGFKFSSVRASATMPHAEIRKLIRSGNVIDLLKAREEIEKLSADDPGALQLVHEAFAALSPA